MARIMLDPGHSGNPDPGAVGAVSTEAEINMAVCGLLRDVLTGLGHEVAMTREGPDPASDDLWYRTEMSNQWAADLFVSIHCNSFSNPQAHGVETFFAAGSVHGEVLATAILDELVAATGLTRRGVKSSPLYVTGHTYAVACLVELAFISNPEEESTLTNPVCQQIMAEAIARGIARYLG